MIGKRADTTSPEPSEVGSSNEEELIESVPINWGRRGGCFYLVDFPRL